MKYDTIPNISYVDEIDWSRTDLGDYLKENFANQLVLTKAHETRELYYIDSHGTYFGLTSYIYSSESPDKVLHSGGELITFLLDHIADLERTIREHERKVTILKDERDKMEQELDKLKQLCSKLKQDAQTKERQLEQVVAVTEATQNDQLELSTLYKLVYTVGKLDTREVTILVVSGHSLDRAKLVGDEYIEKLGVPFELKSLDVICTSSANVESVLTGTIVIVIDQYV